MDQKRLVLTGGLVVDGCGGEPIAGDVLVLGDAIEAVVPAAGPGEYDDREVVDCSGRIVAPGFVDIHTHSDLSLLAYPGNESRVTQGVTTEIVGNCGMSPAPVGGDPRGLSAVIATIDVVPELGRPWADAAGWLDALDGCPTSTNVVAQLGHGSARFAAGGVAARPLREEETVVLEREIERALDAGCGGVSLGLMYPPGEGADDEELARVALLAARRDVVVSVHLRDYAGDRLLGAVDEVLRMAERSGARLQISHLRRLGDGGNLEQVIERIADARLCLDVAADVYPYVAGHTTVTQLLPSSLRGQGAEAVADACRDAPDAVASLIEAAGYAPADITVMKATATPEAAGVNAGDVDEPWEWLARLLSANRGRVDVAVVSGHWPDVDLALSVPWLSIASDGTALAPEHRASVPHPRSWGAFPAAYRRMRSLGITSADAILRMSTQPAARFGLDRTLRAGRPADLVVFEEERLGARADYTHPSLPAVGIDHVFVGGDAVLRGGSTTACRPGRLLRGGQDV